MNLLGSAEKDKLNDKNEENLSKLEIKEVVLLQCRMINVNYQQVSKVLLNFIPNKAFG